MGVLEKIFRKQQKADEQAYYAEGSEEYKKALAAREARWAKGDQRTQEQHREDTRASIQRKLAEANKPQVQRQTGQPLKPKAQPKTKVVVYRKPQPALDFGMIDSNLVKGIYNTSASLNNYNSHIANYNSNFNSGLGNIDKNLDEYNKRMKRLFG